jgi:hypothetical protein
LAIPSILPGLRNDEMKSVDELVAFSAQIEGQGTEDHQNCTYTQPELRAIANQVVTLDYGSRVVEIGVYTGRSASLFFQVQEELRLDIHLVDNWSWDQDRALATFNRLILDNFNEVPFTLHKMRSDTQLGPMWKEPIDLLHIDGWHDLPGIEADCYLWLPWVNHNGIAVFHDSDCDPVADCIARYCKGYTLLETAFRTTVWRKSHA